MHQNYKTISVAFAVVWLFMIACTLTQQPSATPVEPSPFHLASKKATPSPTLQSLLCRVMTHANDGQLNLRSGPGTQYAVLAVLHEGDPVQVSISSADWLPANANGHSGWVNRYFIACNAKGD